MDRSFNVHTTFVTSIFISLEITVIGIPPLSPKIIYIKYYSYHMEKEFGNWFYFPFWSSKQLEVLVGYFFLRTKDNFIRWFFLQYYWNWIRIYYYYIPQAHKCMHIACIHMKDRKEILLKSVPCSVISSCCAFFCICIWFIMYWMTTRWRPLALGSRHSPILFLNFQSLSYLD